MSFFRKAGSDSESSSESEEELLNSSDEESGSDAGLASTLKASKAAKPSAAGSTSKPKAKGSKFLRGDSDSSSSEEESSDEEETASSSGDSSDDDDKKKGAGADAAKKKVKGSMFLKKSAGGPADSDDSSDESDSDGADSDGETTKVVKSAKDKRMDEMLASEKTIGNAERIGDWASANAEFDKLSRLSAPLPGSSFTMLPPVYFSVVVSLEEKLASAGTGNAGGKKKMNATVAKALTALKQKIKKAARENEAAYKEYKDDAEAYELKYKGGPSVAAAAAAPKKTKKLARGQDAAAADEDFMTVGKGGKAVSFGAGAEGVFKNLQLILEARGKKNTDRSDQLKALNHLYTAQAQTVYAKIRVLLALVSSYFDYASSSGSNSGYMPFDAWTSAREKLNELIAILRENVSEYVVQEVVRGEEYDDLEERAPNTNGAGPIVYIRGNVISLVERLDDEFFKSLQNIDPHASEYVERLKDEKLVYDTIVRAAAHFEKAPENGGKGPDGETPLSRALLRRLEHIYSKPDIVVGALEAALSDNTSTKLSPQKATAASSPTLTRNICVHLYKNSGPRLRLRAMLCHVYHCALHDDYYTARNMFNMSNVQSDIVYADVETQGLFNRTLVQLGLCAFRSGLIEESEQTLREIIQTQRVKELLFQGLPTFSSRHNVVLTPEQEKIEKSRQLPFHMHINLELLECIYLVSSMLIEVPQLAKEDANPEMRKQVSSRTFRRMLDHSERQAFTGPPENKRDHVIQASKALAGGDWQKATELISSIKIWGLMPNEQHIKDMLARKIREQALRTYLFTSARFYNNISLEHLCATLSLPLSAVTPIVSKMIWDEDLSGSLDQNTSVLSLHRVERSTLQQQSVDLLEKAENMIRLLNHSRPIGGLGDEKDGQDGGGGQGGRDGQQERRGGERRRGGRGGGGYRGRGRGGGVGQFSGPIRAN